MGGWGRWKGKRAHAEGEGGAEALGKESTRTDIVFRSEGAVRWGQQGQSVQRTQTVQQEGGKCAGDSNINIGEGQDCFQQDSAEICAG